MKKRKARIPIFYKGMNDILSQLGVLDNVQNSFVVAFEDVAEVPKYKFKYKIGTDKKIYKFIKECLEEFKGNLSWTLSYEEHQDERRYYIILPKKYAGFNCFPGIRSSAISKFKNQTNSIFESDLFGLDIYKKICLEAVIDIPNLMDWLNKSIQNFMDS